MKDEPVVIVRCDSDIVALAGGVQIDKLSRVTKLPLPSPPLKGLINIDGTIASLISWAGDANHWIMLTHEREAFVVEVSEVIGTSRVALDAASVEFSGSLIGVTRPRELYQQISKRMTK